MSKSIGFDAAEGIAVDKLEFDAANWDLTCYDRQPVAILSVKVSLSLDDGKTWLQGLLKCDGTTEFQLPGGSLLMKIGHEVEADEPMVLR